jgi:hypothetical protein
MYGIYVQRRHSVDVESVRCSTGAMNCPAKNGHLEVVRLLHANREEGCTKKAMTQRPRKVILFSCSMYFMTTVVQ